MRFLLIMALAIVFNSPAAAAQWELLDSPSHPEFCVATNLIEWSDGATGEFRFGEWEDKYYLSVTNDKWDFGAGSGEPFFRPALARFDAVDLDVTLITRKSHTAIIILSASMDVLSNLLSSKTMVIHSLTTDDDADSFGIYLYDMTSALSITETCKVAHSKVI